MESLKMEKSKSFRVKKRWFIQTDKGIKIDSVYKFKKGKKVLGQGTYGDVMKGQHRMTKQIRAIKVIPKKKVRNKQRFLFEIEILRNLDHPNICRMYESYEDDRNVYIVMELCAGGELFDKIINTGIFVEKQARSIFTQIMQAINYMHSNKIAHRDLKPENFLFLTKEKNSQLKVIDFGLSKVFGEDVFHINEKVEELSKKQVSKGKRKRKGDGNTMNTRAGTPYYIAPEVIKGEYNESCDIWSVGVILYILLCGYPPFYGDTDNEIMRNVQKGKYDFEGEEWEEVDEGAIDLIKHMICPEKHRYTAQQVLDHPWCQQGTNKKQLQRRASKLNLNFKQMKKWRNFEKFKKVCLTLIASQLGEIEIEQLRKDFQAIDSSGDGAISAKEFKKALQNSKINVGPDYKELFNSVDAQKSGHIDYTEFLAASMDKTVYMKQEKLYSAFQVFDKDGNGKISAEELQQVLGSDETYGGQQKSFWKDMIKNCDENGDGYIDYDEFVNMMSQ